MIEAFSEGHLMIGSDWPVCMTSSNFDKILSIVFKNLSQFSKDVQNKIIEDNCTNFFLIFSKKTIPKIKKK